MNDINEKPGALELVQQEPAPAQPLAVTSPSTPMELIAVAVQRGASVEEIDRLMALAERMEANQARKEFVADMAAFKRNPPEIIKDKRVGYENKDGSFTGYKHASLGAVTNAIVEGLAKHGFSHRWAVQQDGDTARVTCTITHRMGHSESVSMQAAKDDSGKKNAIQQVASTVTYLQRYTLLAATGLATHDQDDDAAGADAPEPERKVSQLLANARAEAGKGRDAFALFWKEATPKQRNELRNDVPDLEELVKKAGAK